jgi:hypothetical protein
LVFMRKLIVFFVRLALGSLCAIPAFLFLKYNLHLAKSLTQINFVMLPAAFVIVASVHCIYSLTEDWAHKITGEPQNPKDEPSSDT